MPGIVCLAAESRGGADIGAVAGFRGGLAGVFFAAGLAVDFFVVAFAAAAFLGGVFFLAAAAGGLAVAAESC